MWIEFPCNSTPNHRMERTDTEQTETFRCNLWTGKSVLVSQGCHKKSTTICCCSVAKWCLTLCDPMDLRLPCPSSIPGVYINSCPLSRWYYSAISLSDAFFSFCTQSFSASETFNESSICISSVQSLGHVPMDCSTPGFTVHHQLPELSQTHVHQVSDAFQPPHPLLSTSPPAFNLSQHQGVLQWVHSSHQVAQVLKLQPQHQSLHCMFRIGFF